MLVWCECSFDSDRRFRFFVLQLLRAIAMEGMRGETLLEQTSIDRLCRDRALARGDNHLAIRWRYAARREQAAHAGFHAMIHEDFAVRICFRTDLSREFVVENIAA